MQAKFKPPLLNKSSQRRDNAPQAESEPPSKKRRVDENESEEGPRRVPQLVFKKPGISALPRKPLFVVPNPAVAAVQTEPAGDGVEGVEGYYNVLWYCSFCQSL